MQCSLFKASTLAYFSKTPLVGVFFIKKGAEMEISARINPISYEKPLY